MLELLEGREVLGDLVVRPGDDGGEVIDDCDLCEFAKGLLVLALSDQLDPMW